ncbi:hypothetical protein BX661DRAFT_176790 [Kickxella alabastrina]|uniref:uncharacterized protein n=1 Tax=Kickxella alabastrina TaxID=61397 RepID=UPI00221FFD49|nr:uncharacterized protein BX661DRAFT_176790 [Kickxella alabastrina]KAI7834199.1 hypothetical protein BX661DRAFT_176790 [Kickxella alabastrina]
MMDVEYVGPTRYDYGDSDSDSDDTSISPPSPPKFTVRLSPNYKPTHPTTLTISLHAPPKEESTTTKKLGIIYAPCTQANMKSPLGLCSVNASLGQIFQKTPGSVWVWVSRDMPVELHYGWVRALVEKFGLDAVRELVVVDDVRVRRPVVVGLPAAVMNYADAVGLRCTYVRDPMVAAATAAGAGAAVDMLMVGREEVVRDELDHEISTSLYL